MKTRNNTAKWIDSAARWQINVTNDEGVRKTFTSAKKGRAGQTECNQKADRWLMDSFMSSDSRCDKLLDVWLEHVRVTTGTSNYRKNKAIVNNWIRPIVGMLKLSRVRSEHLQSIINNAYEQGRSKKYLESIRSTMVQFFKRHRRSFEIVVPSGAQAGKKEILQPEGLRTLMTQDATTYKGKLVHEWYIHAWRFSVVTGLRPGELIALTNDCITDHAVLVRGAINWQNEHTDGKNKNAIRDEALSQIAKGILDDQRRMLSAAEVRSNIVFPDRKGSFSTQDTMLKAWNRYREHHSLPHVTPYGLRHTYISVVSGRSNMTLAELKSTVGHSKNMDTLGTYGHALFDQMQRIADKTDDAFGSILNSSESTQKSTQFDLSTRMQIMSKGTKRKYVRLLKNP